MCGTGGACYSVVDTVGVWHCGTVVMVCNAGRN